MLSSKAFYALLQRYTAAIDRRPIIGKSLTAGVLAGVGDVTAQYLEGAKRLDLARTARLVGFNLIWSGPSMHFWYKGLDKFWGIGSKKQALAKVACDQLLFAPLGLVVFLGSLGAMEGKRFDQIKQKIKQDYFPILIPNWMVWPAVNFVNFNYIQPANRVLFVGSVAIFWNIFVSWKANQPTTTTVTVPNKLQQVNA